MAVASRCEHEHAHCRSIQEPGFILTRLCSTCATLPLPPPLLLPPPARFHSPTPGGASPFPCIALLLRLILPAYCNLPLATCPRPRCVSPWPRPATTTLACTSSLPLLDGTHSRQISVRSPPSRSLATPPPQPLTVPGRSLQRLVPLLTRLKGSRVPPWFLN